MYVYAYRYEFKPETKKLIGKLEKILIKLHRQILSILYNTHTHTHTHIYTHTYIHTHTNTRVCVCAH